MDVDLSLSEYISRRKLALEKAERKAVEVFEKTIKEISVEREQLRKAEVAAGLPMEASPNSGVPQTVGVKLNRGRRVASETTIKEAVMKTLEKVDRGMTALEILAEINQMLGVTYPRTSLSPQLSRLGKDGYLNRDGVVWYLTNNGRAAFNLTGEPSSDRDGQKNPGEARTSPVNSE